MSWTAAAGWGKGLGARRECLLPCHKTSSGRWFARRLPTAHSPSATTTHHSYIHPSSTHPPPSRQVIFCKMSALQHSLYKGFLASEAVSGGWAGGWAASGQGGLQSAYECPVPSTLPQAIACTASPPRPTALTHPTPSRAGGAQAGARPRAVHAARHQRAQEAVRAPRHGEGPLVGQEPCSAACAWSGPRCRARRLLMAGVGAWAAHAAQRPPSCLEPAHRRHPCVFAHHHHRSGTCRGARRRRQRRPSRPRAPAAAPARRARAAAAGGAAAAAPRVAAPALW